MGRICIIEDDEGLKNTLIDLFQANNFEVVCRDNGHDLEEVLRQNGFDILLLDLTLKDDDGMRVLTRIRKVPALATLPVIILTADVTYERKIEGLRQGATDYIHKPFSINELLLRIKNIIHLKKSTVVQTPVENLPEIHKIVPRKDQLLQSINHYLSKNMDKVIDIDELARHCNMSRSSLDKIMRKTMGTTPALYIRKYKITTAKRLLEQDCGTIKEIAFLCGFQSLSYFSTAFKLVTGKSPNAYKKSNQFIISNY